MRESRRQAALLAAWTRRGRAPSRATVARASSKRARWVSKSACSGSSAVAKCVNRPSTSSAGSPSTGGSVRRQVVVPETEAVEAGVDLEMAGQPHAAGARRRRQRPRGARARHRRGEVVREDALDVAHAERAEDQDPAAIPGLAQFEPLLEVGDGEPGRAGVAQRPGHRHRAVAVGVGLDDREDAGSVGRSRPGAVELGVAGQVGGDRAVVGLDGGQVDPRRGAADHSAVRSPGA